MISRYSSRLIRHSGESLGQSFLAEKLSRAKAYDRIAGFFSPSIIQVAGEEIAAIGKVRVVANSKITFNLYAASQQPSMPAFKQALWNEWCEFELPEKPISGSVLERLYHLLNTGRMEVRILPDDRFGLIHGKAGVITFHDGSKTAFMGSANESITAWQLNYELVWEDNAPEAVTWVQNEFDSLWGDAHALTLTEEIIKDIQRTAKRKVFSIPEWHGNPNPAAPIIESPVYRRQNGLWNHQKYFVQRAFEEHKRYDGARLILADQVGLGKTLQLAMAAQLIALNGKFPVLIIVPKTLMQQWQEEFWNLLEVPSAYWTGSCWVDENGVEHEKGGQYIQHCPRRIGIISQGLISRRGNAYSTILKGNYECVIIDEAHRARRKSMGSNPENESRPEVNNLLDFIQQIATKTKTLLLATATPVQLHPIEAWDLLSALSIGKLHVFGNEFSPWRQPAQALEMLNGSGQRLDDVEFWNWIRNPLPPADEKDETGVLPFRSIRNTLNMEDAVAVADLEAQADMDAPTKSKVRNLKSSYFKYHNPFIRNIIRRKRSYLEETIDPETNKPYLQKVEVQLYGEDDIEALELPGYLQDAYDSAVEYCRLLAKRTRSAGFLQTLLLRRIGSSMVAGLNTARKLLGEARNEEFDLEEEDSNEFEDVIPEQGSSKNTPEENEMLTRIVNALADRLDADPKYNRVIHLLDHGATDTGPWLDRGCILFSQYYDTAEYVASRLSAHYHDLTIGLYAGSQKSAIYQDGRKTRIEREKIKRMVKAGEIKLIVGTDAASEGLNLQILGSLINLDLPWNPTRLEQRKGRIQRIGQRFEKVYVYNMRYLKSVEDAVHARLSARLNDIHDLFGQIPDTLEDVWVHTALGRIEEAQNRINAVVQKHPFDIRYNSNANITGPKWEECSEVLNKVERLELLGTGWR